MVLMFQDQSGLAQGLQQLLQGVGTGLEKRAERQSLQDILSGGQPTQDVTQTPGFQDQFMSMVKQHEDTSGEKLSPEAVSMLWNTQKAQAQKVGPREYTTQQLAAISQKNPQLANLLQQGQIARRKEDLAERKYSLEERKFAEQQTKPIQEEMRSARKELANSELSIEMARDAIEGSGTWDALGDFLTTSTGFEGFRTKKGAELQSAIKQYFLGDLSSIKGGRPNQLIERQLLDAYPKMGRDPFSNRKILLGMQAKEEILRAKEKAFTDLEEQYSLKGKPLPSNAEAIINKKLRPRAEEIQNRTLRDFNRIDRLGKSEYKRLRKGLGKNESLMFDPEGNPFAINKEQVKRYEDMGWLQI